ncbi:MAG TPA: protein-glutamate O-methyltransferase CheR [Thermoanaerobacterales bacterium]|nr:protein-glutamate O-methyltransferase CheR [Thermoanaerobacterales bacterium]
MYGDYNRFKQSIKMKTGIELNYYKEKQMRRRINSLIKRNGCSSYDDYLTLINTSKQHYKQFTDYITINVSEFFRNYAHWVVMEQKIIPKIVTKNPKPLIWSAACSTGEEPYSIAMLLTKFLDYESINILATDIDEKIIKKAKKGEYSYDNIENVPQEYRKFFMKKNGGIYKIDDKIKDRVTFKRHDLLNDKFPDKCNFILCRNVMIYFTEEAKKLLYKKFHNALDDNGVLFVGGTEQIIMPERYGFKSLQSFFYEKIG